MSDKLRECPNPNCPPHVFIPQVYSDYNEYMNYRRYRVSCGCGTSGPWRENEKDAIAAWNILPRAPQWTTYTGEPETLPPEGLPLTVDGKDYKGRCLSNLDIGGYPRWSIRLGGVEYMFKICIGDRYMPWPTEQGGE